MKNGVRFAPVAIVNPQLSISPNRSSSRNPSEDVAEDRADNKRPNLSGFDKRRPGALDPTEDIRIVHLLGQYGGVWKVVRIQHREPLSPVNGVGEIARESVQQQDHDFFPILAKICICIAVWIATVPTEKLFFGATRVDLHRLRIDAFLLGDFRGRSHLHHD